MQKQISPKIIALTFGILIISFAIAFYVIAWQEPTQAPAGGNVLPPLNVGPTGQSKEGGLILNTGGAANGLVIDKGNLCLGADCRSSWPSGGSELTGLTIPVGGCSYDYLPSAGGSYCWSDKCWGKGYCPTPGTPCACTGSTKQIVYNVWVSGANIIAVLCLKTF